MFLISNQNTMDITDFKTKKKLIDSVASKYNWNNISNDSNCGRLSYMDELSVYRIDIYTSKMTVCILPAGDKPIYKKRQNIEMIEKVFKNPYIL
jgi:hypothetical protein